ncbi:BatA domain-containing protein [uncultured Dokdonia sp.]|uniref:BatA domain-containing protein n=1 Tax=uncultured Dokdonia sp. TaxID=575653 RepID=UPI002629D6A6|nr:BatA domain-containing protein [uncultured Dokdonia sp.]
MQFKHPELLYALFLLIIPILVHLFQLRKFQKEDFTNVAFLKQISIQTRKSNTIKKWLVLLMRLGLMAMMVLAFAQPFFTQSDTATKEKETVVYLDNSFSMQAKGPSGQLFRQALQDLIVNIPEEETFTLLTNTETYRDISIKNTRNTLLKLGYAAEQLTPGAIGLKAQKEFSSNPATEKQLIVISDFQDKGQQHDIDVTDVSLHYVQVRPVIENNIVIDSVYPTRSETNRLSLTATLSTQERRETNVPISLYNGEQLIAKATASFNEATETQVEFDIDIQSDFKGKLTIEDPLLSFDNTLYFNNNTVQAIKVLSINEGDQEFLSRIYTTPEFAYTATDHTSLDYSKIPDYNFIIINEVKTPSLALVNALTTFVSNGGSVLCILNENTAAANYATLLSRLGGLQIGELTTNGRLVTTINYDHPLYRNVFDNRIKNFQYPSVSNGFNITNGEEILNFEDGSAFITGKDKVYTISGGLNTTNSNFQNSPLIVPTLYNMAKQSLSLPTLYFTNGIVNTYDIPALLQEDGILSLANVETPDKTQIPLQRTFGNKVSITTQEQPENAGIYHVLHKDSILQQISYNYNRDESVLRYQNIQATEGVSYHTSVVTLFDTLKEANSIQSLWKWFVIFALLFLLMEMLILKFFK